MRNNYELAAYYFPGYHGDPAIEKWHGKGWTEWELVKAATPRFPGHKQPKVPVWEYEDESNPTKMGKKIQTAVDHGINTFIFDWYWHNEGPFLQNALEQGFLNAPNCNELSFALMWANHDWVDIHPAVRNQPYNTLRYGKVNNEVFSRAIEHIINTYFFRENYWRVDGGLYFSIYELDKLIDSFGSLTDTRKALDDFRNRTMNAGLGEIHLNAVVWSETILPGEKAIANVDDVLDVLGFDSATSYVWMHHNEMNSFPAMDYAEFRDISIRDWEKFKSDRKIPYFPNVSVGWDSSPRTIQSDKFDKLGYPYISVLENNSPKEFQVALEAAKQFLDSNDSQQNILTINAWNEWTEGSYLEPDTEYGLGYLEAIRSVFT